MDDDTSARFGTEVAERLASERLAWLTTVGPDGTPQPSLIWFSWTASELLVFSRPGKPKLRNIARSPRVSLHFDSDGGGSGVAVFTGPATIDPAGPTEAEWTAYVERYAERIRAIGFTPAEFRQVYSVTIRVTPEKLRG